MHAFLLSLVLPVQAISFTEYLPTSDSKYTQKRALKPLSILPYDAGQTWHFRKVGTTDVMLEKMPSEEGYRRLTARDRAGKSWFVSVGMLQDMTGDTQSYRTGLDRNGIQDLVIWRGVSENGLTPSSFLILMTFSQQGHPCVFQVDGFYTANETGIDGLLGLQGNGHTQLLDTQFDPGYWTASPYQVKEAKWQHARGWFDKLSYPALTHFTYTSNRELVTKPVAGRDPQTKNLVLAQHRLIKGDVPDGVDRNWLFAEWLWGPL